jgi:GT2 family glycosyltransferase
MAGSPPAVSHTEAERVPISAIVTAYDRVGATVETLTRIQRCRPAPDEILVHVDGNQVACAEAVKAACPAVSVTVSATSVGPGGGRNRLLALARHGIVASFDDDAYPIDDDFFARLLSLFTAYPAASIVTARVFHSDERLEPASARARWVADFSGGASAYRKAEFEKLGGYVPIPLAYGMEEVDLALRLHAAGGRVLESPWLRVFHDTDRKRHAQPAVTAALISNSAVLTFLRYPAALWPIGGWQVLNRVRWLVTHGRRHGVLNGLTRIPAEIRRYRAYRQRVSSRALTSYWRLRRRPVDATDAFPAVRSVPDPCAS